MTVAYLIGQLIGAAIAALLGAVILRLATRTVAGFTPLYWQAYRATYVSYAVSLVVGFVLGFMIGSAGQKIDASAIILMSVVGFFVQAAIYTAMLKGPDDANLQFGRACLVSLVQLLIGVGILAAFAGVIWAIISVAEHSTNSQPPLVSAPPPTQPAPLDLRYSPPVESRSTPAPAAPVEPQKPTVRRLPESEFRHLTLSFSSPGPEARGKLRNDTEWFITGATIIITRQYVQVREDVLVVDPPPADSHRFDVKISSDAIEPFTTGDISVEIGSTSKITIESVRGYPR